MDNGTREGLDKFLKAASSEPETVLHYEFMQDYKVQSQPVLYSSLDVFHNHNSVYLFPSSCFIL